MARAARALHRLGKRRQPVADKVIPRIHSFGLAALVVATVASAIDCQSKSEQQPPPGPAVGTSNGEPIVAAAGSVRTSDDLHLGPPPVSTSQQQQFMMDAARSAWSFIKRNYRNRTGLVKAHDTYDHVTAWDIGSTLGGLYAAHQLGFSSDADYRRRMTTALGTLARMPIFEDSAFNKFYDSRTGLMVGRDDKKTATGYGWSSLDIGRLLIWLKIIGASDPSLQPLAQQIVSRVALNDIVQRGYLQGRDLDASGTPRTYQEGRLGYEQYAAQGYALWGARADSALSFAPNVHLVSVQGSDLPADRRGDDFLTSDPFVLMGLELGWTTPDWRSMATDVFNAQVRRYRQTGIVTMVDEDAVPVPPSYFYYYLLYRNGQPFVVVTPTGEAAPASVRWVSAKAAFAWHALMPNEYTWLALQTVRGAGSKGAGWTAGVFERSKHATAAYNLNTASVVLEAAAYARRGCPFIQPTCLATPAGSIGSAPATTKATPAASSR